MNPFNPPRCGKLLPADVPKCPHCGGELTMLMPIPELLYSGPVAVCMSDECGYHQRSEAWTLKQMGLALRYRHVHVFAGGDDMPISTTVTDDPRAFWPMGSHETACASWNQAVDWYEGQKKRLEVETVINGQSVDLEEWINRPDFGAVIKA